MLPPNTLLQNRYRIKRALARGGMGIVYEAEAVHLGRTTVAVKQTFFDEDWLREQFEREAALLAQLRHPALPKVTDHFSEDAGQFLVMEFIPGDDLEKLLEQRDAPFEWQQVVAWADRLLDALDYIHTQYPPVIHRDIKPANLKLTPRGEILLLDFGLAKNATTPTRPGGSVRGYTPGYAPPEQVKGTGTDARCDIYALGATLYHLLTDQPPTDGKLRAEMMAVPMPDPLRPAHLVNPQIPLSLSVVIARAMAVERDRRYVSAKAMRDELQQALRSIEQTLIDREREKQEAERRQRIVDEEGDQANGRPAPTLIKPLQSYSTLPLGTFEFETVRLDRNGKEVARDKGLARYFVEDLGGGITLEMVEIPSGTFQMGSNDGDSDEMPIHTVTVPTFWLGKYEVTQAQWQAVLGGNPSNFKGDAKLPVEQVSWHDAQEFVRKLNARPNLKGKNYRLPTEAEWEYAARAGTQTPFAFGETITPEIVNYNGNYPYANAPQGEYRQKSLPVGSLPFANAFGLFDLHGNVWEWCQDVWHDSYDAAPKDGSAWLSGGDSSRRVLRGGSWYDDSWYCRSANRGNDAPGVIDYDIGLRVVCVLKAP